MNAKTVLKLNIGGYKDLLTSSNQIMWRDAHQKKATFVILKTAENKKEMVKFGLFNIEGSRVQVEILNKKQKKNSLVC